MDKCRLCQQLNNNLTKVYNNRLKSLAQIILKLKGFQDSLDEHKTVAICENCRYGIENVATFWENIPEAKANNKIFQQPVERVQNISSEVERCGVSKYRLPTIELTSSEQCIYEQPYTKAETELEPIKIRIKLPRKRKREIKSNFTAVIRDSSQQRIRNCPKRYESFYFKMLKNPKNSKDNPTVGSVNTSDSTLNNFPQVALLRSFNSQVIGTLLAVENESITSKFIIICQVCSQIFHYERLFQKHMKTHKANKFEEGGTTKNYSFFCKLCDKSFSEHYAVRRHFRLAHSEERPLKCQHCAACFKYKFNLDYHMAKHVDKKSFQCDFCNKMFIKRYELQIHLRTHTKEKPYKCDLCSLAFAHRSNLNAHKRTKHLKNNKETPCEENTIYNKELKAFTFQPPQQFIEDENVIQTDLRVKNNSSSIKNSDCELRKDNIESNSLETENPSENVGDDEANDKKMLKVSELNESHNKRIKAQPKLGTFQLHCSILKMLPSETLLGLKKWPKSYQSTLTTFSDSPKNSTHNKVAKLNTSTRKINENQKNKELENASECLELENKSVNGANSSTSIVKYKCLQTNCGKKLTNFTDNNTSCNHLNLIPLNEISSAPISNLDTNFPVHNGANDYKLPIGLEPEHNEFKTTEGNFNTLSDNDLVKINYSQSGKLIKHSTPVKKQNRSYLKTACASTSDINVAPKANNINKTSHEIVKRIDDNSTSFLTNSQHNEMSNKSVNNMPAISTPKLNDISKQSLLIPQQLSTLTFTKPCKTQAVLSAKPLITKIEILPPLKTPTTLQNSSLATVPINLVKPPTNYKYQCPYCYKYFKQKTPLVKHIRTHTGEKPYKCNLCPKTYADASNYKKHKILHKNAAEILNISRSSSYAIQNSPAYSTVSDPDPDGIEVMQTIKKFEGFSSDDENYIDDDISLTSSTMEANMWHDALEHALMNDEIRENIKRNLAGINNAILP